MLIKVWLKKIFQVLRFALLNCNFIWICIFIFIFFLLWMRIQKETFPFCCCKLAYCNVIVVMLMISTSHLLLNACTELEKWTVINVYLRVIDFAIVPTLFLFDYGTVTTVWYFLLSIWIVHSGKKYALYFKNNYFPFLSFWNR